MTTAIEKLNEALGAITEVQNVNDMGRKTPL